MGDLEVFLVGMAAGVVVIFVVAALAQQALSRRYRSKHQPAMKRVLDDLDRTIALFSTSGPVLEPSEPDEETRQQP